MDRLTLQEAAKEIGISPSLLLYFTRTKSIPVIKTQEGELYLKETVYRWKQGLEIIPNKVIGEHYEGNRNGKAEEGIIL